MATERFLRVPRVPVRDQIHRVQRTLLLVLLRAVADVLPAVAARGATGDAVHDVLRAVALAIAFLDEHGVTLHHDSLVYLV